MDKLVNNTNRSRTSPSFRNCLMTCLAGKISQICFDEDIQLARPAPVLPGYVCKAAGFLRSTEPCPTKVTTFPFRCMLERRPVVRRSDVEDVTSVCNVPVQRMQSCLFNTTLGISNDFNHGQEVRFETRRRNPTALGSKTCVCYDGQWIARKAVYRLKPVKKSRIICDVHSSKPLEYLRVKKVKDPDFPENGNFLERLSEELKIITHWSNSVPCCLEPGPWLSIWSFCDCLPCRIVSSNC